MFNLPEDLLFTAKEAKQIKDLFWKDKEFRLSYFRIRNAWLLQKVDMKNAVQLMKEELEKAVKRRDNTTNRTPTN